MLRRVGVLLAGDQSYPAFATFTGELRLASEIYGFAVETIVRFAGGRHELLPSLAAEIVGAEPEVIVAIGAVSYFAVRAAVGSAIPVVFAIVVDPFVTGVADRPRGPGTNVTGVTSYDPDQIAEQIGLLARTLGNIEKLAILGDADVPPFLADVAERAASAWGIASTTRLLRSREEIGPTIADFCSEKAQCLLCLEVPRVSTHCVEIAATATLAGLPTMFGRDLARAAPLLAFGTCFSDATRRAASLATRILGGEVPGSLQIETVGRKELIVHAGVARRLKIDVPHDVLKEAAGIEG